MVGPKNLQKQLSFTENDNAVVVYNSSPYFVNLTAVRDKNSVNINTFHYNEGIILKPFSHLSFEKIQGYKDVPVTEILLEYLSDIGSVEKMYTDKKTVQK